jgi:hypothetical protein
MSALTVFSLLFYYLKWHYGRAPNDLFGIWKNVMWFVWHFFSVPILLRTFFSRWRRLGERYPQGPDVVGFASTFIVNVIMRGVGALVRLITLCAALAAFIAALIIGVASAVLWFVLPLLVPILLIHGVTLLFL